MKVALISCVKTKKDYETEAKNLYDSALFKKAYTYARDVLEIPDENIYILSAGYGLVNSCEVIEPYEKTLNGMKKDEKKRWAANIYLQMKEKIPDFENNEYVILAGKSYKEYLSKLLSNHNIINYTPKETDNLPIGKLMQAYQKAIDEKGRK